MKFFKYCQQQVQQQWQQFSQPIKCTVIVTILLSIIAGCDFGTKSRYYFLDMVNNGAAPATVSVSLANGQWTLAAGEAKTVKIENQDDKEVKTDRVFTMKINGETKTASAKLTSYSSHIVLDVTGNSCIAAADYGPQYRGKDVELPAGSSDIKVLKVFQNQPVFIPETWDNEKSTHDFLVSCGLGEKLPDKIKISGGKIPQFVRLISVPCTIIDDNKAFYDYLNSH